MFYPFCVYTKVLQIHTLTPWRVGNMWPLKLIHEKRFHGIDGSIYVTDPGEVRSILPDETCDVIHRTKQRFVVA